MQSLDNRFLTVASTSSSRKSCGIARYVSARFSYRPLFLLLGAVLSEAAMCGMVVAQDAPFDVPAIAPAGTVRVDTPVAPLAVPPVERRVLPAAAPEEALISLRFQDTPVADIVRMISEQGDVEVAINGDVSGILPYINLTNKTPEQALRTVAQVAGLQLRRTDDRAFVIAKELPPEPARIAPNDLRIPEVPIYSNGTSTTVLPMPNFETLPELSPSNANTQGEERREYRHIPVKNVPIRVMAWWIDPRNNPVPLQFATSQQNTKNYYQEYLGKSAFAPDVVAAMNGGYAPPQEFPSQYAPPSNAGGNFAPTGGMGQFVSPYTQGNAQFGFGNQNGGGNQGGGRGNQGGGRGNRGNQGGRNGGQGGGGGGLFDLTERGVDQIIAIDPQNALLVYATEAGLRDLENIVQFLDRPLKQVEIEAQFVTLNSSEAQAFGASFATSNGPFTVTGSPNGAPATGNLSVGFARGNFQATLNSLVARERAKVVTAPRVTAINNLTATLQVTQNIPVATTTVTNNIGGQVGQGQNINFIQNTTGLTVTPTINNDDTITVVMQPQVSTSETVTTNGISVPSITTSTVQTVANLKDGDTIVLGGLRQKSNRDQRGDVPILSSIPILGQLFRSRNVSTRDSDVIVFLTARIIRRLDDTQPVPGT